MKVFDRKRTLFVTDLDGTLLTSPSGLGLEGTRRLNELLRGGVQLTFATARSSQAIRAVLPGIRLAIPAVTLGGSLLTDISTGEHLSVQSLTPEAATSALAWFEGKQEQPFVVMLEDGLDIAYYSSNPSSLPEAWYVQEKEAYVDPRLRPYKQLSDIPIRVVIDITTFVENKRYKTVSSELNSIAEVSVRTIPVRRYPGWTELTLSHQFADKGNGLMLLKDHFPRSMGLCCGLW